MDWALVASVFVGVFAGVVVNVLTYLFVNSFLPLYRDKVYTGLRIDDDWVLEQNDVAADGDGFEKWALSLHLKQKASTLKGTALAQRKDENNCTQLIHYEVHGSIHDKVIDLSFRTRDRSQLARSTFLLEVVGVGQSMVGYRSFYGLKKGTIRAVECVWSRPGSTMAACGSVTDTDSG